MKQFYIKLDIKDTFVVRVSPFNEMDLCAFLDLGTRIKINVASVQLFGLDSSGDFDMNLNKEILKNFNKVEHLYNLFKLPLDYSIFELDLDIFSDDIFTISILDECETTFEIDKKNTRLIKKICNYISEDSSDTIYSLINSNCEKYVCVHQLKGKGSEYKIIDNDLEVKLFFK